MTTFHPPSDPDRCRAIVLIGGQRGRCREPRLEWADLCRIHFNIELDGISVPRVPVKESKP